MKAKQGGTKSGIRKALKEAEDKVAYAILLLAFMEEVLDMRYYNTRNIEILALAIDEQVDWTRTLLSNIWKDMYQVRADDYGRFMVCKTPMGFDRGPIARKTLVHLVKSGWIGPDFLRLKTGHLDFIKDFPEGDTHLIPAILAAVEKFKKEAGR